MKGLLQRFVDVIKERKMAVLEDLAAEFQLRTQEVVQRIEQLEKMGRITGVMDDRGKVRRDLISYSALYRCSC